MPEHFDVIIIGTGAGGGTLGPHPPDVGKTDPAPRAGGLPARGRWRTGRPTRCSSTAGTSRRTPGTTATGTPFQPQVHYFVGGATKLYGAALYRLRPEDFGEIRHVDGVSPAWPVGYDEFEPFYTKAERLYQVHGTHGEDPTEGPFSEPYPAPAVSHEPRLQEISDALEAKGYHPFSAPCGILLDESDRNRSQCIRCAWCDGYPCMVHAKADADVIAVRPILGSPERHPRDRGRGDQAGDRPRAAGPSPGWWSSATAAPRRTGRTSWWWRRGRPTAPSCC